MREFGCLIVIIATFVCVNGFNGQWRVVGRRPLARRSSETETPEVISPFEGGVACKVGGSREDAGKGDVRPRRMKRMRESTCH